MSVRPITAEKAAEIAASMRDDAKLTLLGACLRAGVSYEPVKRALSRLSSGHEISEELAELVAPIALAREEQCARLLSEAETLAEAGKNTGLYTWWLEKKHPVEYGRVQKTEITGANGGPVETNSTTTVRQMSDDELLARHLELQKGSE